MARSHGLAFARAPLFAVWGSVCVAAAASGVTIYVDDTATGPSTDGTSWCDAFRDLQAAIAVAQSGDEIRVAAGTYRPDGDGDRTATFTMKSGVVLMGGFAGCGAASPSARDTAVFASVLSGDLAGNDGPDFANYADNSFHVVTYSDPGGVGAVLDGFTVREGNADGTGPAALTTNQGGGIHIRNGTAKCMPGGPTLRNCTVENNWAAHHGALNDHGLGTVIENCTIRNNHADAEGGGLQIHSGAPTITNCTFLNNSSGGDGGGAWVGTDTDPTCSGPSTATFTNCTFEGNSAQRGGGMFQSAATTPAVDACTFRQNTAVAQGGGVWFADNEPTFTNSWFEGNGAEHGGGMFQSPGSVPTVTGCTFLQNSAVTPAGQGAAAAILGDPDDADGGGVWFKSNTPSFTDCQFIGNIADEGGGTYGALATPTFVRCLWDGNRAEEDGGGYYAAGLNSTPAIVTDCIVRNNHAVRFGGGFDLYAVAPVITNTLFENNLADSGGGGASAHLSFDSFHGPPCAPEACKAVFEDCTFRDNTATNGGGFLATYSSRPVLRRVLFENNSVSTFGGGMHHNGIGGPLFFDDPQAGWASLSECTFRGNSAGTGGGAIQAQGGSDLTAVRCDFWGNSAVGNGGAMDINYHSRATVFNSRFVGNWIPANNGNWGSGGAIIASSEVELLVANSLFSGNSSDYNGGAAVVQLASTATIVNSTFTGNTCVQFGGALLASSDSSVQLVNSIAWDSQAAQGTTLFGASLNVSHSTVEGGWPGVGNVADDPKFVDPDGADNIPGTEDDDPTLAWDSPALNVAAAGYLPADATDLDNDGDVAEPIPVDLDEEARMYGTGLDMGAVELGPTQCPPGMFSATGAPPCTPCSPGSAQPSAGATQCLPCAPGTIAPSSGAAACTPCSTGNYQPSSGATACLPCGCDDADACTINGCDAVSGDCEYPPIPGCSIPTVSAWGLAVFSLLLLIAGTVLAHRRQREVNGFVTANVRGPCRRNLA